jgi:hypothetical protein
MSSMPEQQSLRYEIAAVLARGMTPLTDDVFNSLALRTFAFQFQHNLPYRRYCERRIPDVGAVTRWQDIPAVPTAAFKETPLVAGDPARAQATFRTSGTTRGAEKRGVHYVLDLELYRLSLLPTFRHFVLGDRASVPIVSLIPAANSQPDSSLSYMATTVMTELGTADSWYAIGADGIAFEQLEAWLHEQSDAVCVIGTSLAFVHWFDHLQARRISLALPPGSRVMDTGGFKGSDRTITSDELRALYRTLLGISADAVVNEYGMTEMLSQFYDDGAVKRGPPWTRTTVVDPDTLQQLPLGEIGLLRHFDLANVFSVSAIQTEDLGRAHQSGFELLGRVAGATSRGCSIAMDLFLSAVAR